MLLLGVKLLVLDLKKLLRASEFDKDEKNLGDKSDETLRKR